MRPTDPGFGRATALVVDPTPGARSALAAMLREFGVAKIEQTALIDTARDVLEMRRFDIVLCEYHFPGDARTGMDLVEDVRLAQLLPMATVFIIVSSEAGSMHVSQAVEAAVDGYVLKPHNELTLHEHLHDALQRKQDLANIIAAVERQDYLAGAALCDQRVEHRCPSWLAAARIGAELRLKLGHTVQAMALFETVMAAKTLPWAKLGIARAEYQAGDLGKSKRTLESLLTEQPGYADACDAMGRVMVDQCDFEQALATFRKSCALTPGSVRRLQKFGLLAFLQGDAVEAATALARANTLGLGSANFDFQSLFLLAVLHFDRGDAKALARTRESIGRARALHQGDPRLRRLEAMIRVLDHLLDRRVPEAVRLLRELLDETRMPDLDIEAACDLLAVLARLHDVELCLDDADHLVMQLARRFAVSKSTTELMCRMTRCHSPFELVIRAAYQQICSAAQLAVSHGTDGSPQSAVQTLLAQIECSLNAKLIDLAGCLLRRHRATIDSADLLEEQLMPWRERYGNGAPRSRVPAGPRLGVAGVPRPPAVSLAAA